LRAAGRELAAQGYSFADLTQIFADHRETIYRDDCCHYSKQGEELLIARMVERMSVVEQRNLK
jgi:hypothetical protein